MPGFGNLQSYRKIDFTYNFLKDLLAEEDKKNVKINTDEYCIVSRRIGKNDVISYESMASTISVHYHDTALAVFYPDGTVLFNSLRLYRLNETKKRIAYIASCNGGNIYQRDYSWYIVGSDNNPIEYGLHRYKCNGLNNGNCFFESESGRYSFLPL